VSFAPFVLAALILLAAHFRDERQDRREAAIRAEHEDSRLAWGRERQELLNRIQAPHLIPLPARAPAVEPADQPEDDEWDLVGTIAPDGEA
jgi:hypothetical protein